jgi:hypothetical protein
MMSVHAKVPDIPSQNTPPMFGARTSFPKALCRALVSMARVVGGLAQFPDYPYSANAKNQLIRIHAGVNPAREVEQAGAPMGS